LAKKKKKMPTLSALEKKLDAIFSEWVRRSAADEGGTVECVTCKRLMYWRADGAQAGHFVKRQHRSTRWDERNVNVQCVRCNKWMNGNEAEHGAHIIRKHGLAVHEELLSLKNLVVKYTRSDLEALITEYQTKLKSLEPA
jgi:hypothetical protein